MDAWLNHCPLEPFVEGGDGDPFRVTGRGRHPTGAIRSVIVALYNIGKLAAWHFGIVVAGQDAGRPDFLRMMRPVVGIDFATKFLVDGPHIAV